MNVDEIARHIVDKTIIDVEVLYDNNSLTLTLDDGSIIEIVIDSIYAEVPEFDS